MITTRTIRTTALVVVAAVLAAATAGQAQSRPDPSSGVSSWPTAGDPGSAAKVRPTGLAEHLSLQAQARVAEVSRPLAVPPAQVTPGAAVPAAPAGFHWLSAAIGAAGTASLLALVALVVIARRRRGAVGAVTATLAVLALALAFAGIASAAKPIRIANPQQGFPSDCGSFPILIELEGTEWITLFLDADGAVKRVLGTYPKSKATVTNLDSGNSIRLTLSGPLRVDVTPEGDVVSLIGPWLVDFDPETGDPGGWYLMRGQVSFTADASGVSGHSFRGHAVDICAELAT